MSSECLVTVNVVDANNNAPNFEQAEYFTPVPESAIAGQQVTVFTKSTFISIFLFFDVLSRFW
jgi:hypothetical protein